MDYTAIAAYADVAGAVGGIIASIALIGTLIFVARELRDNTRATHAAAYQANVANTISILTPLATDPDYAAVAMQGMKGPSPGSELDQFRMHCGMLLSLRHYENLLYQHNLGTLEKAQWDSYSLTLKGWLQQPGYRAWIDRNGHLLSDELRAWIDSALSPMDSKP